MLQNVIKQIFRLLRIYLNYLTLRQCVMTKTILILTDIVTANHCNFTLTQTAVI